MNPNTTINAPGPETADLESRSKRLEQLTAAFDEKAFRRQCIREIDRALRRVRAKRRRAQLRAIWYRIEAFVLKARSAPK